MTAGRTIALASRLIIAGLTIGSSAGLDAQSNPTAQTVTIDGKKVSVSINNGTNQKGGTPATPSLTPDELRAIAKLKELGARSHLNVVANRPFAVREIDLRDTPHPSQSLQEVAQLKGLERLTLADCSISDEEISVLPAKLPLWELDLSSTRITDEGLKTIGRLQSLRSLSLANTKVTSRGLADLTNLMDLRSLVLNQTQIDGAELISLSRLFSLQHLELRQTDIAATGLEFVMALKRLRELDLTDSRINDVGLEYIDQIPQLEYLLLGGTKVTDEGIQGLSGEQPLQVLALGRTRVTLAGLPSLKKFTQLRVLDLEGLPVTDDLSGLAEVSTVTKLSLHSTPITDNALPTIARLERLQSLSLSKTGIEGPGLQHLATLRHLRQLKLEKCVLNTGSAKSLSQLTTLERLDLRDTGLCDEDLQYLTLLPKLNELDLTGVHITDAALPSLLKFQRLQILCLGETLMSEESLQRLEGELPFCRIVRNRAEAETLPEPHWKEFIPKAPISPDGDIPQPGPAGKTAETASTDRQQEAWDSSPDEAEGRRTSEEEIKKCVGKKVFIKNGAKVMMDNRWVDRALVPFPSEVSEVDGDWLRLGRFFVQKRSVIDVAQALEQLTEAIRTNPTNARALNDRACVWTTKKEFDKAIEDLNESIRLDPKLPWTWNNRANVFRDKGDNVAALNDYTEAIRLLPKFPIALVNRGQVKVKLGDVAGAIDDYDEAICLNPDSTGAYRDRGSGHLKLRAYAAARDDFNEAMRLDATNPLAFNDAAWLLATCPDEHFRDGKKAIGLATQACEQTRWMNAMYIDTLAAAYAESGDWPSARERQQQAIEVSRDEKFKQDAFERLELYKAQKPYREER